MTEDDRRKLDETHDMVVDLHRDLKEKSPAGEPPLIDRICAVVLAVERGNWMIKFTVRSVLGLGALAAAATAIVKAGFLK